METLKNLLVRYGSMGVLVFIGFLLIVYAGLVVVYLQQDPAQAELKGQIDRTAAIVAKPISDATELEAEYEIVQDKLQPPTRDEAIKWLVDIAAKHGIDIDPEAGKLVIPPRSINTGPGTVGGGSYQVMSFKDINIQSSYANVMALISDLDAGASRETIVLTSLDIRSPDAGADGGGVVAEGLTRADELELVQAAVTAMMVANNLPSIPNPVDYAGGEASNDMAAFPDPTSTWGGAADKLFDTVGGIYGDGDAPGYVLYGHDDEADGSIGELADYMGGIAQTKWFYTCDADGTVSQFTSAEFGDEESSGPPEVDVVLSVEIYSLEPEEEE